jgi:hypothetical protein
MGRSGKHHSKVERKDVPVVFKSDPEYSKSGLSNFSDLTPLSQIVGAGRMFT